MIQQMKKDQFIKVTQYTFKIPDTDKVIAGETTRTPEEVEIFFNEFMKRLETAPS